jgi:NAD-dependent DNA ligase
MTDNNNTDEIKLIGEDIQSNFQSDLTSVAKGHLLVLVDSNPVGHELHNIYTNIGNHLNQMTNSTLQFFFEQEDIDNLKKLKHIADQVYYNAALGGIGFINAIIADRVYDLLKKTIVKKDPNYVPQVGVKVREGDNRAALPFWLGSADKITPDEPSKLERWMLKNRVTKEQGYIITEKLDGVSCLLCFENKKYSLYTRGDGLKGADISYLAKYFKLPVLRDNIAVRGELIITKKTFAQKYENKTVDGRTYKNPRNMVAGLVNGKTALSGLNDINFVTYEIVGDQLMPELSTQLVMLANLGFKVAQSIQTPILSVDLLTKLLIEFKKQSAYELDGIIVQTNKPYERNSDGNPSYMFAFKMLDESAVMTTIVQRVEWDISKLSQLKPVVIFNPVSISGVTMTKATAHNAKYVVDNILGPGAVIKVVRSKDVIPYIVEIVSEATSGVPQMPEKAYSWDATHINIFAQEFDISVCTKLLSTFFSSLGIKFVGEKTVEKMIEAGYDDLMKILKASPEQLARIPRLGTASANRIYNNIHEGLKSVTLPELLAASSIFGQGVGIKRIQALFEVMPNLLTIYKTKSEAEIKAKIKSIDGFSTVMTNRIYPNIKLADLFIEKIRPVVGFKVQRRTSNTLEGKKYVFTGFRDAALQAQIQERGGQVANSVTKNVTAVISKIKGDRTTTKAEKAIQYGIPIISIDEFRSKFL